MIKIFIDAGHGGTDPGAISNGLKEKDLTLKISLKLRDILQSEYTGHALKMSRTEDRTVTLSSRTNLANKWGANYLISIHINAGGGTGFESYIYNRTFANKRATNELRNIIHEHIIGETQYVNRGKKAANFHMLRESKMSASLTENGFIDNDTDARNLKKEEFLNQIAKGHALGLAKALRLKKKQTVQHLNISTYVVKKGDTLWGIAQKYNTSINELQDLNPRIIPDKLPIGQKVFIRTNKEMHHIVQKGDTFWSLAKKYETSVGSLEEWNVGMDPRYLQIGTKVRVK